MFHQKKYKVSTIEKMLDNRDMFPMDLPRDLERVVGGIEALIDHGHVKEAIEDLCFWIQDSPNGMEASADYDKMTYMLFYREVYYAISRDKHRHRNALDLMKSMAKDPNAEWNQLVLFSVWSTIKGDESYIGYEWMDPHLSNEDALKLMMENR